MPNREAEDTIKSASGNSGMPQPDTAAAIEFLKRWRPSGVLTLVAILPDKKPEEIEGRSWITERPGVSDQITRWLAKWQGRRNLYFTANETRPMDTKPAKVDVTCIWAFYSDADPDTSQGYAIGRALLLDEMLPRFIGGDLPATVTIDSGNGLQGLWQGEDGEPVTEGTIESFEAVNKPFSEAMGSKGIFNVDRLLRLPGTINLPNQAKLSKGYPAEPTQGMDREGPSRVCRARQSGSGSEAATAAATAGAPAGAPARRTARGAAHPICGAPQVRSHPGPALARRYHWAERYQPQRGRHEPGLPVETARLYLQRDGIHPADLPARRRG
jgi:hypothetical protein